MIKKLGSVLVSGEGALHQVRLITAREIELKILNAFQLHSI